MVLQLNLPADLEQKLQSRVKAGGYASLEHAIIAIVNDSLSWQPETFGMTAEQMRADLEAAQHEDRSQGVPGDVVRRRIAEKAAQARNQAP